MQIYSDGPLHFVLKVILCNVLENPSKKDLDPDPILGLN